MDGLSSGVLGVHENRNRVRPDTGPCRRSNTGGDPVGPLSMFGVAPPMPQFNYSQDCQGTTLAAGGSCMVSYTFSPTTPGFYVDFSSFTVGETASQTDGENFNVALFGCGDDF